MGVFITNFISKLDLHTPSNEVSIYHWTMLYRLTHEEFFGLSKKSGLYTIVLQSQGYGKPESGIHA